MSTSPRSERLRRAVQFFGLETLEARQLFNADYQVVDLGTLAGTQAQGFGVNSTGEVAVQATAAGDLNTRAALYDGSSLRAVSDLGGSDSYAEDVNDRGTLVGWTRATPTRWGSSTAVPPRRAPRSPPWAATTGTPTG